MVIITIKLDRDFYSKRIPENIVKMSSLVYAQFESVTVY